MRVSQCVPPGLSDPGHPVRIRESSTAHTIHLSWSMTSNHIHPFVSRSPLLPDPTEAFDRLAVTRNRNSRTELCTPDFDWNIAKMELSSSSSHLSARVVMEDRMGFTNQPNLPDNTG